ncbi:MAG: hypothetical protein ACI9DC_005387 [Gammaproteobacteria bacterium]|jgi:hypothetical protein
MSIKTMNRKPLYAALIGGAVAMGAMSSAVMADGMNPNAEKRPLLILASCSACNPCAAKKAKGYGCNPCNPCAAKKGCNPCNPCAAKKGCNPCNPCAAKKACNPCNPCAAKKKS